MDATTQRPELPDEQSETSVDAGRAAAEAPGMPPGAAGSTDLSQVELLEAGLRAAHQQRYRGEDVKDVDPGVLQATCLVVLGTPPEISLPPVAANRCAEARAELSRGEPTGFPEAEVCKIWLALSEDRETAKWAVQLTELAAQPLWQPVAVLAYRGLTFLGRRQTLAALLAKKDAQELAEADAWLEAAMTDPVDRARAKIGADSDRAPWGKLVSEYWAGLLNAEWDLACGTPGDDVPFGLECPSAKSGGTAGPLVATQHRWIGGRAVAAAVRRRLGQGHAACDALDGPAAEALPTWERSYLRALLAWMLDDTAAAEVSLRSSFQQNPHQTCTRLALATLLSPTAPDEALELLDHPEPTREMLSARAALLARTERYDEAETALARAADAGWEAMRFSWPRGRERVRTAEQALKTALAERRTDWMSAGKAWAEACNAENDVTLHAARRLWMLQREQAQLPRTQTWRRSVLHQRWQQTRRALGDGPLVGDARFFRAAALFEDAPELARRDCQALLRQRRWCEGQQHAGGRRLVFLGDALARLGHWDEAVEAYRRAAEAGLMPARERFQLLTLALGCREGSNSQSLLKTTEQGRPSDPGTAWKTLFMGVALLSEGKAEEAVERLQTIEQEGDTADLLADVLCIVQAMRENRPLADEELARLGLPPQIAAVIGLFAAAGEKGRLKRFMEVLGPGWMDAASQDPALPAERWIELLWEEGEAEQVMQFAQKLAATGRPFAVELAARVRMRHALQAAVRGELPEADEALGRLEAELTARPNPTEA